MNYNETICALATAQGGAIGVIRVSGEEAISIVNKSFVSASRISLEDAKAQSILYGTINDANKEIIDEVLVSIFRSPHSYTGENSIEISCHGSTYIFKKVLERLIQTGCRQANPGEFTQRAYLNGKLDLSQAEAVADLIASTNKATHQIALGQLRGHFSSELADLRDKLLKITSLIELELDFSDQDVTFADREELAQLSKQIDKKISSLATSFETGRAIKNGVSVAIVGKTNVGKSTLLNCLLKEEKAIVSNIHGTTRDVIEDTIEINNITFRFIDTAGIRNTTDTIENLGIERTYKKLSEASIILWVIDKEPSLEEIKEMEEATKHKKLIVVANKMDETPCCLSPHTWSTPPHFISISAKLKQNIEQLEQTIYDAANIPEIHENDVIITNIRHYEALLHAQESIKRVIEGININLSGDLLSEDLRQCLFYLGDITGGSITSNEVLGNIFKHFCIGK